MYLCWFAHHLIQKNNVAQLTQLDRLAQKEGRIGGGAVRGSWTELAGHQHVPRVKGLRAQTASISASDPAETEEVQPLRYAGRLCRSVARPHPANLSTALASEPLQIVTELPNAPTVGGVRPSLS